MSVRLYKQPNKWWIDITIGRKYRFREIFEGTRDRYKSNSGSFRA
jgi:hypothetical protein